ncbi:MAG: hypothetical protein BM556_15770 [Bacteriovorax sp. MedPE-SWde]|nr:MAG: hypothetical protein BM556_15770 [Bacteriovorax sp. MedPE-SWde]
MKSFLISLLCLVTFSEVIAKDFVLVGVAGYGTRRPGNEWQPSGAHENLPYGNAYKRFELVHYAKKKELKAIISEFNCKDGKQQSDLGLIVMANSWGSGKGIKLTKMYKKACGRKADLFIMVDGFKKPLLPQGRKPVADKCYNFYQTKGIIHGKKIKTCVNYDLTDRRCPKGVGGIECHIRVEWTGTAYGADIINDYILRH